MTTRTEHTMGLHNATGRVLAVWFAALALAALAVSLFAVPGSNAQGDTVVINEFQPVNDITLPDGQGDFPDWIELRNVTNAPVDLSGWTIVDDRLDRVPWPLPIGTVIQPDGYLIIFASGKGGEPGLPPGEIHTDFGLGGSGDSITLVDNFGILVDTVTYTRSFSPEESQGLDASGNYVIFNPGLATPGEANVAPEPTPTPTATAVPPSPTPPAGDSRLRRPV